MDYFHRNLGITFSEQLSEDRLSVTEIAYDCGFNTMASFYRAFRRVTGESPGNCRPQPKKR